MNKMFNIKYFYSVLLISLFSCWNNTLFASAYVDDGVIMVDALISLLFNLASPVAAVFFLISAFMYFFSSDQKAVDLGRQGMKSVLIGYAIIMLSGLIAGIAINYAQNANLSSIAAGGSI